MDPTSTPPQSVVDRIQRQNGNRLEEELRLGRAKRQAGFHGKTAANPVSRIAAAK
jgi:hypothetical protein